MGSIATTELALAEKPALEWLQKVGWSHIAGPDIAPDSLTPERDRWSDVVLRPRLLDAISRLNPELPSEAVKRAGELVLTTTSPNVIDDHYGFHELLVNGVPVAWSERDGTERTARAQLVDFRTPANNDFVAVSQFTIIAGTKNRRPDVLLFVNGLPLAQLELKRPGDPTATAASAVNQIADYRDAIPDLYRYVEIVAVSDRITALAGTITTPAEHFAPWKSMDPADDQGRSALEVMVRGMLSLDRLLDLVESFCVFETDGTRTWKLLAKYHQVDAVNRAVEATRAAMGGSGRAGVVWHTQGSGKSLTMVFYAQKLRREPAFANPTIVAVTDRNDLDQQLYETFARQRALAPAVKQADSIDTGEDSLRSLLQVPAGGIVFSTIQKFATAAGEAMPILSERENVIVMADEAHRSQYGSTSSSRTSFAENLTLALPNATRIGFTGTPIERSDRSTRMTFGDYISVYSIARAVEDGATVPIYYESRRVPIEVGDESLLEQVDDVLADEEDAARHKLTAWAKLERVVGQEDRLERVATDVAAHYRDRTETLVGKALVVGMSRPICARLANRLKELLGDEAATCVMSVSATDDALVHGPGGEYRRSKQELRQVAEAFKDPDHPLRLVVVRDMWLTGFDVPSLHTLYVDKPMRDHGLLQAIARVNRVFRDKSGGLIVDYIGIGDDLRKSLSAYDESIADEAMVPLETAVAKLREKHEVLTSMLHPTDIASWPGLSSADQGRMFDDVFARIVADEELAKRFMKEQALFARWLSLASTHPTAIGLKPAVAFLASIAGAVRKIVPSDEQASPAAEQAVKQFMSEGLAAGEVVDVFALMGEERPELSLLSEEFLESLIAKVEHPDIGVAALRKLLDDQIRVRTKRNQLQARLFSDRLNEVLRSYQLRQLTSAEIIQELVNLAKQMRDADKRDAELGLSREEIAFYDALAGGATTERLKADAKLAAIARELVAGIRADLSVDWSSREASHAALRRKIKRLLRKHHYKPPTSANGIGGRALSLDEVAGLILQQAFVVYAAWPDI